MSDVLEVHTELQNPPPLTMSSKAVTEILEEAVPLTSRGNEIRNFTILNGSNRLHIVDYENDLSIACSTHNCSVKANCEEQATVTFKRDACESVSTYFRRDLFSVTDLFSHRFDVMLHNSSLCSYERRQSGSSPSRRWLTGQNTGEARMQPSVYDQNRARNIRHPRTHLPNPKSTTHVLLTQVPIGQNLG